MESEEYSVKKQRIESGLSLEAKEDIALIVIKDALKS